MGIGKPSAAEARAIAAVHKYIDAHNNAALDDILELFADEAKVFDPAEAAPRLGKDIEDFYFKAISMGVELGLEGSIRATGRSPPLRSALRGTAESNGPTQ